MSTLGHSLDEQLAKYPSLDDIRTAIDTLSLVPVHKLEATVANKIFSLVPFILWSPEYSQMVKNILTVLENYNVAGYLIYRRNIVLLSKAYIN